MKYRITKSNEGYRAEIGYVNIHRGTVDYIPIENDDDYDIDSTIYYYTEEEAVEACKEHHEAKGYDSPKVVREFELY